MPKIVDHELFKKELLQRCVDLLGRKGYSSVTMRQIARELDVSTGLLYHYFPTKESIFEGVVRHLMETDVAIALDKVKSTTTLREKVEVFKEHWSKNREYYMNIMLLMIDFYRNNTREATELVAGGYSRYYREKMAESLGMPESLAHLVFVFMIGMMYHEKLAPKSFSFDEILGLFSEIVMFNVEKNPGLAG